MDKIYIINRIGHKVPLMLDKITNRIGKLCYDLDRRYIDPSKITIKVAQRLVTGMTTSELDNLAAQIAVDMMIQHPDYATLAARIVVSDLHRETPDDFIEVMRKLREEDIIDEKIYTRVMANADALRTAIQHSRDFNYTYFGIRTLQRSYLHRIAGKIIERPQYMLMRVALQIHTDMNDIIETYNLLSQGYYIHSSPTLYHAASKEPQMASCFLLTIKDDSIEGIFETLKDCAIISKKAGGIGLNVHDIRARKTPIAGTRGESNGLVPMLRVFNNAARYVDQGGNKRPGAFAIYLEPWHADIFDVLDLRKNDGSEELRARDLFYALWIPDLFMRRVLKGLPWSLMCPHQSPGLSDVWGDKFETMYCEYERKGLFVRQVDSRRLWRAICDSQIETGTPFMLYKDTCNRKSNHNFLGTIKNSNLCTEIVQYSDPGRMSVCNLACIALNKFVTDDRTFDFEKLKKVTKTVVRNLSRLINYATYPVDEARALNEETRPLGIGVQGLADAFLLMRYPFISPAARKLNIQIFETIYYAALEASCELAKVNGAFIGFSESMIGKGILHHDLKMSTVVVETEKGDDNVDDGPDEQSKQLVDNVNTLDWSTLRENIKKYGVYNSLLVAVMPTASTAQILGNNESIEPYTSNFYTRSVQSGEFQVLNPHLARDLLANDLWKEDIIDQIRAHHGSIQSIADIPTDLKELYKTVWEIRQKSIVEMAADRAPFIDQSQSLNIHLTSPTHAQLNSLHFTTWKLGLKTGMYYLRTQPATFAAQVTVYGSRRAKAAKNHQQQQSSSSLLLDHTTTLVDDDIEKKKSQSSSSSADCTNICESCSM